MDQLKVFWAGVVKYHFWILTCIVLLASLAAFHVSRTDLDQKVESRISKLDGDFRAVTALKSSAPEHPNSLSDAKMDEMLTDVTSNVKDAWTKQAERQKPILKWNRKAIASDEAHTALDSYRPIELHLSFPLPADKELPVTYRDGYRNYIKDVFPDLARIIGARWTAQLGTAVRAASSEAGGNSAGADGESSDLDSVVIWSQASQSALQSEMIPWYNPFSSPSTIDICYTQEDIWILEGILKVFKATNGKAKENFQAPIKELEWIKIGRPAGGGASGGGVDAAMAVSEMSTGMTMGAGRPDPANNRYVDSNYNPVPAATLRQAMNSSNPEDAFFAVAKRVPVRFRVRMDQGKIAKLLVECGNADLMIEVKQVRINAYGEGGISVGSNMDSGGGMEGGSMNPGIGGAEGGGGALGGGGVYGGASGGEARVSTVVAHDPPVEVYGIVYLFNPVDLSKLGLEKVTENTTLVTATDATPAPAAEPDAVTSDAPVASDAVIDNP